MNFIVAGSSAGLGRALATELARKGHSLVLIASDAKDLQVQASDLQVRFGVPVITVASRIRCDEETIDKIVTQAQSFGDIDGLLFPMGLSSNADDGTQSASHTQMLVDGNLSATMALTAKVLPLMMARNRGYVVGFGSVAAERGRSSNVVYAAAKRGLMSFFESIRHKVVGTGVKVRFFQMGYIKTSQTFGKKLPFPAVSPEEAARDVLAIMEQERGLTYYPAFWRWICLALKMTPWFLYRRLRF